MVWLLAIVARGADVSVEAVAGEREVPLPAGLALTPCVVASPTAPPGFEPVGQATIELRLRRGRLSLVTRSVSDAALQPSAACFERELAAATWPIRRGRVAVSVTVEPEPAPVP